MPSRQSRHSAEYDENGDIILPKREEVEAVSQEEEAPAFVEESPETADHEFHR
jgi:hypothetical protein